VRGATGSFPAQFLPLTALKSSAPRLRRICHTAPTMPGDGLAHPLRFAVCLATTLLIVWLWRRFMDQR